MENLYVKKRLERSQLYFPTAFVKGKWVNRNLRLAAAEVCRDQSTTKAETAE